jgi:hypothetical protein
MVQKSHRDHDTLAHTAGELVRVAAPLDSGVADAHLAQRLLDEGRPLTSPERAWTCIAA